MDSDDDDTDEDFIVIDTKDDLKNFVIIESNTHSSRSSSKIRYFSHLIGREKSMKRYF